MTDKQLNIIKERMDQLQPFFIKYIKLMNKIHNPKRALMGFIFTNGEICWWDIEKEMHIQIYNECKKNSSRKA